VESGGQPWPPAAAPENGVGDTRDTGRDHHRQAKHCGGWSSPGAADRLEAVLIWKTELGLWLLVRLADLAPAPGAIMADRNLPRV